MDPIAVCFSRLVPSLFVGQNRRMFAMPEAFISPQGLLHHADAEYTRLLVDAGFEIRYPEDPTFTQGRDEQETVATLQGVSALIAGADLLTPAVIDRLPDLRVIARAGVGYDRVDVPAATARRIPVTITPTANHQSVAEHVFMLMLAVQRQLIPLNHMIRAGQWGGPMSVPLRGQTLGLVGFGRIGQSVASRANAFGMRVVTCDPFASTDTAKQHDVELVEFESLLCEADIISIHAPLNDQTAGLFNARSIGMMKQGSVLINTARGGLVVESDLVQALKSGHVRAAGLDVFEREPVADDNPLLQLDNVVLTPHRAGAETLAQYDMGVEAARCIVELYAGRWPAGCVVNNHLRDGWSW